MKLTILGIFDSEAQARRAAEALSNSDLDLIDLSIIAPQGEHAQTVNQAPHLNVASGAALGAGWGAVAGVAAFLIPGVGPLLAGGALGAALTGAVAGAAVGGIAGALVDTFKISHEDARHYENLVQEGRALVAVKTEDRDARRVREILATSGAESLREHEGHTAAAVHVATYDETGSRVNSDVDYSAPSTGAAASNEQPVRDSYVGPTAPDQDPYDTRQRRLEDESR